MKESDDGFFFEVDGKVCSLKVLWFSGLECNLLSHGGFFYART